MRKLLGAVAIAGLLSVAIVPAAMADSQQWRVRTLTCGTEGPVTFVLPPSEYNTAFVPLHEQAGPRVLVPFVVTITDETGAHTYVAKPLAANAPERMTTCSYIDPFGLSIDITGTLKPAP